ncbi:MAG: AAA family ATPase [Bacteroidales bacterium]|nr:AAA family ATPase [Bacteroidales bacterium]
MDRNPQIELAEKYVMETGVSVFLTGKAGTGKTTFLHHIVEHCSKRNVVLAPTGVAAVNAGGVTIHSFFQLPFCPYLPDIPELVTEYQMPEEKKSLRKSKVDIIRTLELLIIDEISMVRADLLDAIDATLRRYRHSSRPFGGVQLLMIGDVQQLAPVVTEEERPYMDRVYPSPFFFHSKALQRMRYITIQLTTIYRQQDPLFVSLLNNIRDNHDIEETIAKLNERVAQPQSEKHRFKLFKKSQQEPILLTTHNYQADRVNQQRMQELKGESRTFEAVVSGNFPDSAIPTERSLEMKVGAQVMFVKNDSSGKHRYFNGKIGTVKGFEEALGEDGEMHDVIVVADEEDERINVTHEVWENIKYEIDASDNQIKQIVDGTFSQYPLKTAWAVTIHKAQGLTFDRVQVNASEAFTYGQVYVALSRCRTLEGLTLLAPLSTRNVFDSHDIDQFNGSLTPPDEAERQLDGYRIQYYYDVLFELFDFSAIQHETEQLERLYQNALRSTYPMQASVLTSLTGNEVANIVSVAERFHRQLSAIGQGDPASAKALMDERIGKAAPYFIQQITDVDKVVKPLLGVDVDNKETEKRLKEIAERYRNAVSLKLTVLNLVAKEGFSIKGYQKAKADAALEKPKKESGERKSEEVYTDVSNPKLIPILTKWRRNLSHEMQLPAYTIITQKSLLAIADKLPRDKKSLLKIPGLGAAKVDKYGADIIQIVEDYCEGQAAKVPLWHRAAQLYAEGKSIEDIGGMLLRANSTVEGYLLTAVENGVLDPDLLLSSEEQDEIVTFLLETGKKAALKSVYEHFQGRYSYLKLRVAGFIAQDL